MPIKVLQDDGTEIETYTPEEVEAMAEEKALEAREQIEREAAELRAKAEEQEAELEKLRSKDLNFSRLRKQAEKKEVEVNEDLDKRLAAFKEEVVADVKKSSLESFKNEFIATRVGSDKEMLDKFNYYYEKLSSGLTDQKAVERAANEALALAGGGAMKPSNAGVFATSVSMGFNQSQGAISETKKEMGKLMGLSEEDYKKYGGGK